MEFQLIKKMMVPQGEFELDRYPNTMNASLQAFDAADEYILNHLDTLDIKEGSSILILNDNYGALSLALNSFNLTVVTDSFLSKTAIYKNFELNGADSSELKFLDPLAPLHHSYDLIVVKIPKKLTYLEFQLQQLAQINKTIPVVAGAMARHIHRSTIDLFENYLKESKTSLAKKKARLFFSMTGKKNFKTGRTYPTSYKTDDDRFEVISHANCFSGKKLDIGTRFLIENMVIPKNAKSVVDLGCGNGVVGLYAASELPEAKVICIDESFMAVESARESFSSNRFYSSEKYIFKVGDSLKELEQDSIDLVLCNPPFHQEHAVTKEAAKYMFVDSRKALKEDGELWVVANRHLEYHVLLKKMFQNVTTVASNSKFVILKASHKR
jgi:23S rRNA (guanine1835-N2)-methyltransferase